MTTNTTNSQAASIADDQNTREETFVIPLPIFNGVLLQALKEGCTELRRQDNEQACRVTHALMAERDEWKDRAIAAEARLAEIQRGVEGLKAWLVNSGYQGVDIEAVSRDEVLAMFAQQGQSDECRMEDPQWTAEQIEKLKAAGSQPFEFNRIEISDDSSGLPGSSMWYVRQLRYEKRSDGGEDLVSEVYKEGQGEERIEVRTQKPASQSYQFACMLAQALTAWEGSERHQFTVKEINLFRQWFDNVEDLNQQYLELSDYDLAKKLYPICGCRWSDRSEEHRKKLLNQSMR